MLASAYEDVARNKQLIEPAQGILKVAMPVQSQKQAQNIVRESDLQFDQITKKTAYLEKRQYFNPSLLNKISPFKFVNQNYQIRFWQKKDIQKISLIPLLSNIVVSHIQRLLQMETQIDPFTKKLIKMPDQKTEVVKFVTSIADKSLQNQFQALDEQYEANHLSFHNKRQLWKPLLTHVMDQLQKVNYMIELQQFSNALFNPDLPIPIIEQDLIQMNTEQLKKGLEQKFDTSNQGYPLYIKSMIIKHISKKRKIQKKKPARFFAIIKQATNYQKMVDDAMEKQANTLQGFSNKNKVQIAQNKRKIQEKLKRQE